MRLTRWHGTAPLLLLLTPTLAWAQEDHSGGGLFSINPGLSIWTTVIFLALLAILWRFAWAPILGAVEARESRIQGALDASEEQRREAQALLEEHKRQLADARRQVQEIVAEGKAAGEKVRRDIEDRAREEGQAMLERAREEIGRERDAALAELRRESVELALGATAKLLRDKMDPEADRAQVAAYVNELTAEADAGRSA